MAPKPGPSGPSISRIASSRYPQHNRQPPEYTYPVVHERLKPTTKTKVANKDQITITPTVSTVNNNDSDIPEPMQSDSDDTVIYPVPTTLAIKNTMQASPKGKLKTTFYGVRKPGTNQDQKRKWNYKCSSCDANYPNQSLLNNHFKASHPPVTCDICDLSFNMPSTLARHRYVRGELKFFCSNCNKGFPFAKDRNRHLISHKQIKSHFCVHPGCKKGFFNKHDLTKHAQIHDKKNWNCPQCEYSSPDQRNLKAHMCVHSDLKPYLCTKCLQLFKYHIQLVRHQSNSESSCYDSAKYGTDNKETAKSEPKRLDSPAF